MVCPEAPDSDPLYAAAVANPLPPVAFLRRFLPGPWRRFPVGRVAVVRIHGPISGGGRTTEWI
jgi:hypothetical protein